MTTPDIRKKLPRRDYFILPILVISTILVVLAAAEVGARLAMPQQEADACMMHDALLGARPKPNCISRTKNPEGEWVENKYNECGYRSDTPCHAPLNGAWRIVVVGSSTGWGYQVPTDETWYTRTAAHFSQRCGRPIDVQNLGGLYHLDQTATTLPAALAEQPKVVVMFVAPFDLDEEASGNFTLAVPHDPAQNNDPAANPHLSFIKRTESLLTQSRAVIVAEHFLFRQPATYIPLYMRNGDKSDFLRQPFTAAWQRRLVYADAALGYIADKMHQAGVPFVLVFAPQQAQADIVATGEQIPGVNPYAIDLALQQIAKRHGIIFADMTPGFRGIPDAPDFYLNVDGHLSGIGQAMAASLVEKTLAAPGAPFFECMSDDGDRE